MPSCSPLFIDKLAVTLEVRDETVRDFLEDMLQHQDHLGGYALLSEGRVPYFRLAKTLQLSDKCKVLFQCIPTSFRQRRNSRDDPESSPDTDVEPVRQRRFLRMEWNPSIIEETPALRSDFLGILRNIFGDTMEEEFLSARITRIDLATDVRQLPIEQIAVARQDNTVSSAIYYGRDGRPQTIYLGAKDSDLRFAIYDKRAQSGGRVRSLAFARTRIEARIKARLDFSTLLHYQNPFSQLLIREYVAMVIGDRTNAQYQWEWFLDSCKARGLEAALSLVPGRSRYNWSQRVTSREPPNWWNPDELWEGLGLAIERLGFLGARSRRVPRNIRR
jgi:hypothetical protein